jgi:hypothetical protein
VERLRALRQERNLSLSGMAQMLTFAATFHVFHGRGPGPALWAAALKCSRTRSTSRKRSRAGVGDRGRGRGSGQGLGNIIAVTKIIPLSVSSVFSDHTQTPIPITPTRPQTRS